MNTYRNIKLSVAAGCFTFNLYGEDRIAIDVFTARRMIDEAIKAVGKSDLQSMEVTYQDKPLKVSSHTAENGCLVIEVDGADLHVETVITVAPN